MSIKAFISHSSAEKEYALELVNSLGRDRCIIDCYDFEPAYQAVDEIFRAIDRSSFFVLLISKNSLDSEWVQLEISKAISSLSSDKLDRFIPYIIDPSLGLSDIPDWLTRKLAFNLRYFRSPQMIKKDLEEKMRRLQWQQNPMLAKRELTFIGRNAEIDEFQTRLFSARGSELRAHITSGRPGIGKDSFAKECLAQLDKAKEFEPYRIIMDPKDSIENFILHLNAITKKYSDKEIHDIFMGTVEEKVSAGVELLNDIYQSNDVVFIEDNMACVQPTLKIAKWLTDILESPNLVPHLGLFIQSILSPQAYIEHQHPRISHVVLHPLSTADRKKLFYMYAQSFNLTVSSEDASFFVNRLLYSPKQLMMAVETINSSGIFRAKKEIDVLVSLGDGKVKPIFEHFKQKDQRDFLILLSKFEFLSFDIIERIYGEEYTWVLDEISNGLVYGIMEVFGPNDSYVKLDHYISDYIRRNKLSMSKDLELHEKDVLDEIIASSKNATDDVSLYLHQIKSQILAGRESGDTYLIPSIVIKAIIDLYESMNYSGVIKICDKVLSDGRSYYPEIRREIYYWQCSSFCRKPQNATRFYETVDFIDGADNHFLRGFFFRNAKNYPRAEEEYRAALKKAPNMKRAKRELVSVLLAQRNHEDALGLAAENYRNDPENTYHIYAYFRCLIKTTRFADEDIKELNQLMEAVKTNLSPKRDEIYAAMEIEYNAMVDKKKPSEMLKLIQDSQQRFPFSVNVKRAADDYRYRQGFIKVQHNYEEEEDS